MKNKIVIVLGCYRSGTSLVAQLLHKSGVYMGDEKRKNFTAFYEDRDFIYLNKEIYKNASCVWVCPNSYNLSISSNNHEERIRKLIDDRNSAFSIWGWKDPVQALVMSGYWKCLDKYKPYLIVTSRDLVDCAKSLKKFYTFKANHIENAIELLMKYLNGIYSFMISEGNKWLRFFVSYEKMIKDDTLYKEMCNFIGIKAVKGLHEKVVRKQEKILAVDYWKGIYNVKN